MNDLICEKCKKKVPMFGSRYILDKKISLCSECFDLLSDEVDESYNKIVNKFMEPERLSEKTSKDDATV